MAEKIVSRFTKGGICSSPKGNEVQYKEFLKRESDSDENTHDQRCKKFLA